jgi:hypothetical protein
VNGTSMEASHVLIIHESFASCVYLYIAISKRLDNTTFMTHTPYKPILATQLSCRLKSMLCLCPCDRKPIVIAHERLLPVAY